MNLNRVMTLLALISLTFSVQAQTPRDLDDLVDMRASSGERELADRGYRHHKTMKVRGSSIAYWWNPRKGRCIAATTKDGRYSSIVKQPDSMCGDNAHDQGRGHHGGRSKDVDDLEGMRASSGERALKERGYYHRKTVKFGGGTIGYWWNPRQQRCIAANTKGGRYTSVVDQATSMCDDDKAASGSHHRGDRGGIQRLVGMRASSGERELRDRGYELVSSKKGSDRIWANWWNRSDRKCITVVTMDGRYDSITDSLPADCNRRGR